MRSTHPARARPDGGRSGWAAAAAQAMRAGGAGALASPAALVGRCLFYVFLMTILSAFWDLAARHPAAGALAHVPKTGLALYVGATEWITLSVAAVHLRLEDDIRQGALESWLLRPKPYLLQALAESLGVSLVRLAALGAAALVLLVVSGRPTPPWPAVGGLIVLAPGAAMISILAYAAAGLSAFWARRSLPAYLVLQKLGFLLGGLIAPVSLYPPLLARLAAASPFAAQMYWPGRLMLEPSWSVFAAAVASQLLWLTVLAAGVAALWRAGLRKLLKEGA